MALAETGTRGLLGAALGSAADRDEATVARRLLPLLRPGMLVLLDRAFDANAFLGEVAATGALLLARAKSTRHPPVLGHLPDGSYLSHLDGLKVRVIEASVTVTGADGSRVRDGYRLITTLMDHRRFPAAAVVRLYHERWEIESAYFALRHTLLDGHVLRSGDRPGLEQETWALLTLYQLLRMAMVTRWRPARAPTRTGPASPPRWKPPKTSSPPPTASARTARPTCPARSAGPCWPPCCPPAAPGSAPARSNAPPPGTSTATTAARPIPPPSPRSTSPSAPRPSTSSPAGPTATGTPRPPPPARPAHPPRADHRHHHQPPPARLERPRTRRPPARQTPEHAHPARRMGTPGLLHPHRLRHLQTQHAARRAPPRQTRPTLNFAALARAAAPQAPLTRPAGSGSWPAAGQGAWWAGVSAVLGAGLSVRVTSSRDGRGAGPRGSQPYLGPRGLGCPGDMMIDWVSPPAGMRPLSLIRPSAWPVRAGSG